MNLTRHEREGCLFDLLPEEECVLDEIWDQQVYRLTTNDIAGRTVLDIGAHVGVFTVWALHHGAAHVVAFEPSTQSRARLHEHLALNDMVGHVMVCGLAVGDREGDVWLGEDRTHHTGGRRVGPVADEGEAVRMVPMTYALRLAGEDPVVKIDAEGSEYAMMRDPLAVDRMWRLAMEFDGTHTGGTDQRGEWARMVTVLAEAGHLTVLGRPSRGGYIYWTRY